MSTGNLALLALLSVSLTSCKKDSEEDSGHEHGADATMQIQFQFLHGNNAFDMSTNYTDGTGHAIRFSDLRFYASGFHLEDDGGAVVADYSGKVVLADGASPAAVFTLGTMGHGHVHEVHFNLGLDNASNHADFTTASAPLNVAEMHPSVDANGGYTFLLMEGTVDGNGDLEDPEDVPFAYACATDALLREDHAHIHADVDGGTVVLVAKVDVATLVSGLDLLATPVATGDQPANIAAMDSLVIAIEEL